MVRNRARCRTNSMLASSPAASAAAYAALMLASGGTTRTTWPMAATYMPSNTALYSGLTMPATSVSTSSVGTRYSGRGRYFMHSSSSSCVWKMYSCGTQDT